MNTPHTHRPTQRVYLPGAQYHGWLVLIDRENHKGLVYADGAVAWAPLGNIQAMPDDMDKAINGYAAAIDALRGVLSYIEEQDAHSKLVHPFAEALMPARAVLAAHDGGTPAPVNPPTAADLENLAALHGVRVAPDLREGCFNLYWPNGTHAFAVSVRDAMDTIQRDAAR